tara:strand:+ start:228 stop:1082 length:855 start_codon:yes stop_codon:yes gene_type:complete
MSDEKSDKLAKLRNRVQEKLVGSRLKSRRLKKDTEEDIVIKVEKTEEPEIKELPLILDEAENRRSLASTLVLIGSIMGIVSGVLILQGNPSDLLTSNLFSDTEALDIHGSILDREGNVVQDVTIELIDPDTEVVIKTTLSDDNGRYKLENVTVKDSILRFSKAEYTTVELLFTPEPIGISTITMLEGDGKRIKDERSTTEGWSMEDAVALATIEGLITIGTALVGVHASFEIRRAVKYRRTQILCWVALFSRGLIIFGPTLIVLGMILLTLNREEFQDYNPEDE